MPDEACTRICAYCQTETSWIWNQKKLKDGSRIYTDSQGRRWAGRRCPACEKARVQAAVRCDGFEREIILAQLIEAGYSISSSSLPIKVQKDGLTLTVGIRRAFTRNGQIIVEGATDPDADIFALLFESVRVCTAEQMDRLSPKLVIYSGMRPGENRSDEAAILTRGQTNPEGPNPQILHQQPEIPT